MSVFLQITYSTALFWLIWCKSSLENNVEYCRFRSEILINLNPKSNQRDGNRIVSEVGVFTYKNGVLVSRIYVTKEGDKWNCYLKCPTAGLIWKTGSFFSMMTYTIKKREGFKNLEQQLKESSNIGYYISTYKYKHICSTKSLSCFLSIECSTVTTNLIREDT